MNCEDNDECAVHSKDDPRYEAGVTFFIAADLYCHALAHVMGDGVAGRFNRAAQMMLYDTLPVCLYMDVMVQAVSECYKPDQRQEVVQRMKEFIMGHPHEPSARQRATLDKFMERLVAGE